MRKKMEGQLIFENFNDRAVECLHLAERVVSPNDQNFFRQLAFAWLGRLDQAGEHGHGRSSCPHPVVHTRSALRPFDIGERRNGRTIDRGPIHREVRAVARAVPAALQ
jgi:hypothetical protein